MTYHSRFRRWTSDSLLEGKVIFGVYLSLLVTFVFYPDLAIFISNYLSTLPILGIVPLSGTTSLVMIPIIGLFVYVGFIYLIVHVLWAMDTSAFEDKLNRDVSRIAELLGHSSYIQLKSDSESKDFRTFLSSISNERPRFAWFRRAILNRFVQERTPIGILREHLGLTIWELIFLTNYVRLIETRMRQSTQAPSSILEYPIPIAKNELPFPKGLEFPFTNEEIEIITYRIDKDRLFSLGKRILHRLNSRWISPIVLLEKGIVSRDYKNGNVDRFVKTLTRLIESHHDEKRRITIPSIVSRESIASIVRSTDKQYDFKIEERNIERISKDIWSLQWKDAASRNFFESISTSSAENTRANGMERASMKGNIFEIPHTTDFTFNLYENKHPEPALAPTAINIEGYLVHGIEEPKNIQIIDNVQTSENLDRIQRLLLGDLFQTAIDGNILTIEDPSNIRLLLEAFIKRQVAIQRGIQPDVLSDPKRISLVLLGLNVLGQTAQHLTTVSPSCHLFTKMRVDSIIGSQTLATSGLLGLDSISDDVKKKIQAHLASKVQIPITIQEGIQPGMHRASFTVDIPQLGLGEGEQVLSETRRTESVTESGTLVWAATGAGAWIIKRNNMHYFTRLVTKDEQRGLMLIHHPLREQVFLETLTHRNYHYVWEILRNRVRFQEMASFVESEPNSSTNVEFVWVRESFLPSGNSFILNDDSREILEKVSKVCQRESTPPIDYCVMLTRSNQLIRGPVNGLNMIFAECTNTLSPLPAMTLDIVLRQRMFEEVAQSFSRESGLIDDEGKPTPLAYAVNWLRPLQEVETQNTEMLFEDHSFSDPSTWNNLGFLEILVKETKCAYALIKVLSSYASMLKNGDRLPFRLVQNLADESKVQDIDHLSSSYDMLCDFLTGEGDFSKQFVYATGKDKGYLDWLEKVMLQLPAIGKALENEDVFFKCILECDKWLSKIEDYLGNSRDPLKIRVERIHSKIQELLQA
ncbi:MAG: hypothetical protein JW779_01190 [Candidatus Thorarchaeota archaeon]|nr:hypothetical protein [Candidatus Thorarchaeota archaeon]